MREGDRLVPQFAGAPDADAVVDRVLHGLIDHPVTTGLARQALEDDPDFHDVVLPIHNAGLFTFLNAPAYRLIETLGGRSFNQADAPNV